MCTLSYWTIHYFSVLYSTVLYCNSGLWLLDVANSIEVILLLIFSRPMLTFLYVSEYKIVSFMLIAKQTFVEVKILFPCEQYCIIRMHLVSVKYFVVQESTVYCFVLCSTLVVSWVTHWKVQYIACISCCYDRCHFMVSFWDAHVV